MRSDARDKGAPTTVKNTLLARCGPLAAAGTLVLALSACGSRRPTAASTTGVAPASTAERGVAPDGRPAAVRRRLRRRPRLDGAGSFADMAALPLVTAAAGTTRRCRRWCRR